MRTLVEDFNREELFHHYNSKENPFSYVTIKLDITNIYKSCKTYYASIAYFLLLAANEIDNFKYRYENGKFYKYDKLRANFTEMYEDKNIGFFSCELKNNYYEYLNEYNRIREKFLRKEAIEEVKDDGEIWFSCEPWFSATSIVTPFSKDITIPQFTWDKFVFEDDKCYTNLTIMTHHGFIDGYYIGLFIEKLNNIIENIDKYL